MHVRRRGALIPIVVAVGLLAGCGGSDDTAACDTVDTTINGLAAQVAQQTTDPTAAGQTYLDAAADIRAATADSGDEVAAAAGKLATEVENLGKVLVSAETDPGAAPDTAAYLAAAQEFRRACG